MAKVQVFEPAMCCSTGVCGPSVDQTLVRFAADMEWLTSKGVSVERTNLSQQPHAFVNNPQVRSALQQYSTGCLPLVLIDGQLAFRGGYPTLQQLAERLGLNPADGRDFLPIHRPRGCC